MANKKISLNDLVVESFITAPARLKGGGALAGQGPCSEEACSFHTICLVTCTCETAGFET